MGHQFPGAVVAAAVVLALAGCGGAGDDGAPPPVLDVARGQVASGASGESAGEPAADAADGATPAELPPPDPSTYEGSYRVVNLFAPIGNAGDEPTAIDVWARRTFTNGPVLLAQDIGVGVASAYFSAPAGADVVVVSAGAGPDGEPRATLPVLVGGEQVTTVFTNDDREPHEADAVQLAERGTDAAPVPPADEQGLVVVVAANLESFDEELRASVDAAEFLVGDGTPTCRTQRGEAAGVAAGVLGPDERIELDVAPGSASITFHPAPSPDGCDQRAVARATVEVAAGETVAVLVYTLDGDDLATLTVQTG